MNVFLQHKLELVKNNFTYSLCMPVGVSFDDAKEVMNAFKAHLEAMEKQQLKQAQEQKKEEPQDK